MKRSNVSVCPGGHRGWADTRAIPLGVLACSRKMAALAAPGLWPGPPLRQARVVAEASGFTDTKRTLFGKNSRACL